MERCFENLYTPHKVKMGAVGCPRNCAEATVKDIGLVGQEGSWQVVVGGVAGKKVRKADIFVTVETTGQALESASLFFQYFRICKSCRTVNESAKARLSPKVCRPEP